MGLPTLAFGCPPRHGVATLAFAAHIFVVRLPTLVFAAHVVVGLPSLAFATQVVVGLPTLAFGCPHRHGVATLAYGCPCRRRAASVDVRLPASSLGTICLHCMAYVVIGLSARVCAGLWLIVSSWGSVHASEAQWVSVLSIARSW